MATSFTVISRSSLILDETPASARSHSPSNCKAETPPSRADPGPWPADIRHDLTGERFTGKGPTAMSFNAPFYQNVQSLKEPTSLNCTTPVSRCTSFDPSGASDSHVDVGSLASTLKNVRVLSNGKHVHAHIIANGLQQDVFLGNLLIQMYSRLGALENACVVFAKMGGRNIFSWTIMIKAFSQNGHGNESLELYHHMQLEGVMPDKITFLTVISTCSGLAALTEGKAVHNSISNSNFASDVVLGNALIDMYGKCNSVDNAKAVFSQMPIKDLVTWNSMIKVNAQHEQPKAAVQLFYQMLIDGLTPDAVTFMSILDGFSCQTLLPEGIIIHSHIVASGLELKTMVGTALLNMYGKCGSLEDARRMFHKVPERDLVLWNAMIGACASQAQSNEAIQLHEQMELDGLAPNARTYVSLLDACANNEALIEGEKIHYHIKASGLEANVLVGTALMNLYAKCGNLDFAKRLFGQMSRKDVVAWNAMLVALAQHGKGQETLQLFEVMKREGTCPNKITLYTVLSACCHSGMISEGQSYFLSMRDHGVTPMVEHYNIMIDILVRSGRLREGEDLIYTMPFRPSATSWRTLLGGCRTCMDVERGKRAAKYAFGLDPKSDSTFVLLSDLLRPQLANAKAVQAS